MDFRFNNKFARLGPGFYSQVLPTGFAEPIKINFNLQAAALIGADETDAEQPDLIDYFCGNRLFSGADYLASVYSGHQFGSYVPQLGDGRAIMVGEINGWEVQLKGSGRTPYSRFGDGRAVLRSCIREYLCSEAMHNLGIPTTRALCIIGSDEDVQRETVEKGAMLTRLSPSHIRFGHFEYFYYTGQHDQLRQLADFVIGNFYPGCNYKGFFEQVVLKTARLIAQWQAVGFAHGVMNTDNMSILALTLDYGPFGFVEEYNPGFICNHSDYRGRYAFDQQPYIGLWNLHALAQSLSPLVGSELAGKILKKYQPEFAAEYMRLMRQKLGTPELPPELIGGVLDLLDKGRIDYTNFFRKLGSGDDLRNEFVEREKYDKWHEKYAQYQPDQDLMLKINPKYILRNYMAENAIQSAVKDHDYNETTKLLHLLQRSYDEQPGSEEYAKNRPEWAKTLEVSCSS